MPNLQSVRVLEASQVPAAARQRKFDVAQYVEILNFAAEQDRGSVIEIPLEADEVGRDKAIKGNFKRTINARPDGLSENVVRVKWLPSDKGLLRFRLTDEVKRRGPRKARNNTDPTMTPVSANRRQREAVTA